MRTQREVIGMKEMIFNIVKYFGDQYTDPELLTEEDELKLEQHEEENPAPKKRQTRRKSNRD